MSKFECKRCQGQVCTIELSSGYPAFCVKYSDHDPEWDEITNDAEHEKQETELSEWCKWGSWVYDNNNWYGEIITIQDDLSACYIELDGGTDAFVPETFTKLKQARLRPWTAREAIGKVICWKGDYSFEENISIITHVDAKGFCSGVLIDNINLESLSKKDCFYQPNGKPCGVLEHLDNNGEWVE